MSIEVGEESPSKRRATSSLEMLRDYTEVVVDSAKLADAQKCTDATTNPSLIYAAVTCGDYDDLVREAFDKATGTTVEEKVDSMVDQLIIAFVSKISSSIPGVVSVEVDPDLSFDTEKTYARAKSLVESFMNAGIDKSKLLIKIATTWEGIRAAERLEKEGFRCNLTLLFSFVQALACADANVYLISPFVGRITDWHIAHGSKFDPESDPGVLAVQKIYNYYKKHEIKTLVMGASFRNSNQVKFLCGCDKLTIPPKIITELDSKPEGELKPVLSIEKAMSIDIPKEPTVTESVFRWELNEDAMATEKLSEGIRKFNQDWIKLKKYLEDKFLS